MAENYISLYLTFLILAFVIYAFFDGFLFIKRAVNKQQKIL
jgi:hypothetical protein